LRSDWIISGCAHAAVLAFGLVTLASSKPNEDLSTFMPIAIATGGDVSQAPPGQQNAPRAEKPKPLADKAGELKQVKQLAPKVADKPEIATDAAAKPTPKPKAETKAETKPTEKTEKPKPADLKPDQIGEKLKKEEAKKSKPEKKEPQFKPDQIAEELRKDEAKKPSPKFDANQVAALLDQREPRRQVATAETPNSAASLGAANGRAAQLSQSELDALRARLSQCWSPPPGVDVSSDLFVVLHVLFKADGSLASEPAVVESSTSALGPALADSAKRALLLCQPFTMLKPEHYDQWKDIEVKFDPHELLGG
jgi:colicin import membrane protein